MTRESASTSARPALVEANLFTIEHPVLVTYSRSSLDGQPRFDYQDVALELHLRGADLHRTRTAAGELVTVVLQRVPDVSVRSLTLIVPEIRMARGDTVDFETVLIETTDRSGAFVAPPGPRGVLTTYRVLEVSGSAQQVDF